MMSKYSTKCDTILLRGSYVLNRFNGEWESKLQLRCRLVSDDYAEVHFSSEPSLRNETLLCRLYLEMSTPVSRTRYLLLADTRVLKSGLFHFHILCY